MRRGRAPCCVKTEVRSGWWTAEEDEKLVSYIQMYGHQNWRTLPRRAGLQRCGKSCRLRWVNYLRPGIKHGNFTEEEEVALIHLHRMLGNQWSKIASYLPGRTDNEIKNIWNTYHKKRTIPQFYDPLVKSLYTETLVNPDCAGNLFHAQNHSVISSNTLPGNHFTLPASSEVNCFDAEFWKEKDGWFTGPAASSCAVAEGKRPILFDDSERWLVELEEELGLLEKGKGEWKGKEAKAVMDSEQISNFHGNFI